MPVTTVHAYDQSKDGRWYAGEVKPEKVGVGGLTKADFDRSDTSEGVCFSLSVWWIVKRANGVDFWTWLPGPGPQVGEVTGLFRKQKQKPVDDPAPETWRFLVARDTITAESPLEQKSEILMNEGTALEDSGYYYVSIQGRSTASGNHFGHGVAMQIVEGGRSRYFDPNFGEFETDTVQELMEELSKRVRGYKLKDVKIYFCCFA